ncbi:MAG: hypothetical protein KDC26_08070 [Armatimonadetes bacterium]|nr:hypothetical protein [Armatimonadota bacterium]
MKKSLIGIAVFCTVISMGGCAKKDPLAGTWNASVPPQAAVALSELIYTFDSPNFTVDAKLMGMPMTVKGTYTLADTQLTMNPSEVIIDESKLPDMLKPQWSQVKAAIDSESKKSSTYTVTFAEDTATLSGGNGDVSLTRKK